MIKATVKDGVATLRLSAKLESFERNKSAMLKEIGMSLLRSIRQGFASEQSPEGTAWAPLKPSTVRQRKGDAHPILRRRGVLAREISCSLESDKAFVGTNLVYAKAHQFGATIKRKAGSVKLHFRRITRGKGKGQVRFASPSKAKYGMAAATPEYSIRIPARPYLFQRDGTIPETWLQPVTAIVLRRLEFDDA